MNKADEEDSEDEAIEEISGEAIAQQLMFASGVYDPYEQSLHSSLLPFIMPATK